MNVSSLMLRIQRSFEFARHVPPSQLVRRVELNVRRRLRDHFPPKGISPKAVSPLSKNAPRPIFAPRGELKPQRDGNQWRFTFLHRSIDMPGPDIDWMAPGSGPQNQLLRMNLHYMEYLEGCDDRTFSELAFGWIAANSQTRKGAWRDSWNSYALSLRVVVWLQELARRAGALTVEIRMGIEASACEQILFLEQNLETDIGGNHLVKNIKALLWASACFVGNDADRWRGIGLRLLSRELDAQVLADGVHYERSPSYHCQVFADFLECRHALGVDLLDGRLDTALERMAQATADLAHADGLVAQFNDAGLSMCYSPEECLDAYQRLFGKRPSPRNLFAFPDAGYFGLHTERTSLIVDCGRVAPDELPAHGHADVLSFEWSVAGERIIVDQGVFEYVAGDRRAASRSAVNHNTLCVDGADQADFFGAFRCGRRPDVELLTWRPEGKGFVLEGTHNGFRDLPGQPRHTRQIVAGPDLVEITDRLKGASDRASRVSFLLHPEIKVHRTIHGLELSGASVRIAVVSSLSLETFPAVWWPDMGRELPTTRMVVILPPGQSEVCVSFRVVPPEGTD